MRKLALFFLLLRIATNTFAQTNTRGWYADGQVWIVWQTTQPEPETYAIYTSATPFTDVNQASLVGRLFKGEWVAGALAQQTQDSTQNYRVPDGDGGIYRLTQDEGLFVETVHETGAKYYAVVKWGETAAIGGINLTTDPVSYRYDPNVPVQCHAQIQIILSSGHHSAIYYMWADGRDDHWNGRPDFPVMANHHKNGMPSMFILSEALNLAPNEKRSVVHWLHGGGGEAIQSLPTGRKVINIEPQDGYLVAHNDDFYRYFGEQGQVLGQSGNSAWFGWAKHHDPFVPGFLYPTTEDTVINYTQRRILWINDWLVREVNADPERIAIQGHSRGAAGTTGLAKTFPNRFATASLFNNAFGSVSDNDSVFNSINNLYGLRASELNLPTNLRNRNGEVVRMNDMFNLSTPIAKVRDMPLIRTWHGKNDDNVVMHWDSTFVAEIRSADAAGWGAQIYWDERSHSINARPAHWTHGNSKIEQTERDNAAYQERYRVNQSFPAFYNHQSYPNNAAPGDGTPGTGANGVGDDWGTWGGWHDWDLNTLVDETDRWAVTAYLIGQSNWVIDNCPFASLTADLAIRKPQRFKPETGKVLQWSVTRISNGQILQSGTTRVGADDLVLLTGITIYKDPDRMRIRVSDPTATAVETDSEALPTGFRLSQNYPNPFNSGTTIKYEIPREAEISIIIYNLRGEYVTTLINAKLPAGRYKTRWDGRNKFAQSVSTGVYIYELRAGDFSGSRKFILLK